MCEWRKNMKVSNEKDPLFSLLKGKGKGKGEEIERSRGEMLNSLSFDLPLPVSVCVYCREKGAQASGRLEQEEEEVDAKSD
mmetsp:Transcript_17427/g.35406  ORF Transcript_17427/g.35406 Transcript_17427/m.35406 type:complete len:81 (+) Transcript_17427:760-1002(+)